MARTYLHCISSGSVLVLMKNTALSGFHHEIWQILCMKFGRFHEIRQISGPEIWRISCMKSGGFHMQIASFAYEIWQIS